MDTTSNNAQQRVSALEITINVFSFSLMWASLFSAGTLFFAAINRYFPDPLSVTMPGAQNLTGSLTYAIAALIVSLPLYLITIRYWVRTFTKNPSLSEGRLSRFLTYIILLAASLTVVGDLISLLYNFLQGEFGARFVLKSLAILILAAHTIAFYYHERAVVQFRKTVSVFVFKFLFMGTILIALGAIILGFIVGGSPMTQRAQKFDSIRAEDLSSIESNISSFVYETGRLPATLEELSNTTRYGYFRTADPSTGEAYSYEIVRQVSQVASGRFKLCATFEFDNREPQLKGSATTWYSHASGRVCNEREAFQNTYLTKPIPASPTN